MSENLKILFYKTRLGRLFLKWIIKEFRFLEWNRFIVFEENNHKIKIN